MRTLLISALLLASGLASAQQINGYRYWYDDNTASATTIPVSATDELVLNTALPTGSITPGHHRITMQVRDSNGNWSAPRTNIFVRTSGMVNGYRYWLNDDPTTLVTAAVTPTATINLANDLAMGNLTRNFNWVTFQFKEADGRYSVPKTQAFVRGTGEVNGYEYWIDDAIASSTTGVIGSSTIVDLIADLPVPAPWGNHTFTIRFSSTNGTWSVPLTTEYYFFTAIDELPGITDLVLFPNPVSEELGMRLNTDAARTLNMQVLDISGAMVQDLSSWSVRGSSYRNWDISDLASGSYVLRMSDGSGTWSTRFVKR